MKAYAQEAPGDAAPAAEVPEDTVTVELPASSVVDEAEDVPQQVDVDPGAIVERVDGWVDMSVKLLPNIAIAIVFVVVVALLAALIDRFIRHRFRARGREHLGHMVGGMVK